MQKRDMAQQSTRAHWLKVVQTPYEERTGQNPTAIPLPLTATYLQPTK
jgi:hypothetical protein